jgi:hypothetical protein
LSDRILIAENGCAALFVSTVSPDSETAALQFSVLVRPSISVVQGPDMAEPTPKVNSATLARMNVFVFIAFSFRN